MPSQWSCAIDAALCLSLAVALVVVQGVDSRRRDVVQAAVGGSPQLPEAVVARAAGDTSNIQDVLHEEAGTDEASGADTVKADAAGDQDRIAPRPSAGIIADFVPFKPELVAAREPLQRDLVERPVPPPADPVMEDPPPSIPAAPEPRKVEFFETETRAASVGFVVDCSSSMAGPKFEAVRAELAKSIAQLKRDQRFFVVFFNEGFFPMTGNVPRPRLMEADRKNKHLILSFLRNATTSGGTNPEPALRFMGGLRPEVIYLLTDGGFSPLQSDTYSQLDAANVSVHTIGFETGATIPILQEIASRTRGTYRSAGIGNAGTGLFFQSESVVRSSLKHADPAVRREAISVAIVRELPFVKELIGMLEDSDESVRQTTREELRGLAEGSDFGPRDSDDASASIARWTRWWSLRKASREVLVASLKSADPDEVWIAASLARTDRLDAPDEIIAALRTAPSPVWQELRAALRQSCTGQDFGPADGATSEQIAEAADRWADWRATERERLAKENHAKRIRQASEKLRLARYLVDDNPVAVARRCREILKDFADTPSAVEAMELLREVGGSLEEE